jgi:hypothetical protein
MRSEKEIKKRFKEAVKNLRPWDEDDLDSLYDARVLGWVLKEKVPEPVTRFDIAKARKGGQTE